MDYQTAFEQLRSAAPTHVLLRILATDTPGNRLILERELQKLAPKEAAPVADAPEAEPEPEGAPEGLVLLLRKQSDLFGERRKASNKFHTCNTDRERRAVSEEVQIIQRRIEGVRAQIRMFKRDGYVPDERERYDIPTDPIKLVAKQQSLRSSISRQKRIIAQAESQSDTEGLTRLQAKLQDLQNHLTLVEASIANRDIQH
jgi:hypothetical protein